MKGQNNIDAAIKGVVEGHDKANQYFTKEEVVGKVCSTSQFVPLIKQLKTQFPGWAFDQMFVEFIESRVTKFLQQTQTMATAHGAIKIRKYENYGSGHGPRRWLQLRAMGLSELRIVMATRRQRVAREQRVIRVYERLLALLEGKPAQTKVADIFDQALEEAAASLATSP